jgi:hypothetical protein
MNIKQNEHTGFCVGILITIFIGSCITSFNVNTVGFSAIPDILLFIILGIFIFTILGLLTSGISWIFTKNFTIKKWLKHVAVMSLIWTFLAIISFVKNRL